MRHRPFFINGKSTSSRSGGSDAESLSDYNDGRSSSGSSVVDSDSPDVKNEIKCCIIGDEAVGKTAMIVSYLSNGYPEKYTPTVHDCFTGKTTHFSFIFFAWA